MDIGMSELLLIGIVALIVIGPRDLPEMFRQLGRMTAKMRSMAREFSRAMEQAANETGVKDIAKDLQSIASPKSMGLNAVKDAVNKFEKWDPIKNAAKPSSPAAVGAKPLVPPPMPATPATVVADPADAAAAASSAVEVAVAGRQDPATMLAAVENIGPNTAALYEKQAARAAILKESVDKLKALNAEPVAVQPVAAVKAPRRKKVEASDIPAVATQAVATQAVAEGLDAALVKPARAPRKKKVADA